MARCAGFTRDGRQCTAIVRPPSTRCYQHDPARAGERKRNASKAGRGRGSSELTGIKSLLSEITDRVLGVEGTEPLEPGRASVAAQLLNTRLRALEVARRVREQEELLERIEALEKAAGGQKGGKAWGR